VDRDDNRMRAAAVRDEQLPELARVVSVTVQRALDVAEPSVIAGSGFSLTRFEIAAPCRAGASTPKAEVRLKPDPNVMFFEHEPG
jgi:hypothetical protein